MRTSMWPPVIVPTPTLPRPIMVTEGAGEGVVTAIGDEGFGGSGLTMKKLMIAQMSAPTAARAPTICVQRGGSHRRSSSFLLIFKGT